MTDENAPHIKAQMLLQDALILDTETTGLDEFSEVMEICVIDTSGNVLFETLLQPDDEIDGFVVELHGITPEMVKNSPKWPEIQQKLECVVSSRQLVSYNAKFDKRLIEQTAQIHHTTAPQLNFICAMELFSKYVGDWNESKNDFEWYSLSDALEMLGLKSNDALHRARSDCLATLNILKEIASKSIFKQNFSNELEESAIKAFGMSFDSMVKACQEYARFSGWLGTRKRAVDRATLALKGFGSGCAAINWKLTGEDNLDEWKKERLVKEYRKILDLPEKHNEISRPVFDEIDKDIYSCCIYYQSGMTSLVGSWEQFAVVEDAIAKICEKNKGRYYRSSNKSVKFAIIFSPMHHTIATVCGLQTKGYKVTSFDRAVEYFGLEHLWNLDSYKATVERGFQSST